MRVYSINTNKYNNNYPRIKPVVRDSSCTYIPQQQNDINFTGFNPKINYQGLIIKYIKTCALKTSRKASKRPYLSQSKNLKGKINEVKIKVNLLEEINAWDINPKNSDKYVIFLHGFSQNITNNQPLYEALAESNYGILAIDYRGYGRNRKTINVSENDMRDDVIAAKKYLKAKGIENIGLIGHSFGAYLSTKTSKTSFFNFQILVSPMLSLKFWLENVLKHPKKYRHETLMIKYIPKFKEQYAKIFRLRKHISGNTTPTYIIHSKTDRYINYADVKDFSLRLNEFKEFMMLERGGHKMDERKINAIVETLNKLEV